MQVDSCGKLLRAILRVTDIIQKFRSMNLSYDVWLADYVALLTQIDSGLEPDLFHSVAHAIGALLLMHNNTPDCDWLRPAAKRKKSKRKKKSKKSRNNDDDDDDDHEIENDDEDDGGLSTIEKREIDERIVENDNLPMINISGNDAISFESLWDNHLTFVPYLKPLFFERSQSTVCLHPGIKYALLLVVHTCNTVTETLVTLKKCHKKILQERHSQYQRLGYKQEKDVLSRIMVLGWGNIYKSKEERNYREMKATIAQLNLVDHNGVSFEFFSIEELQHDITKGNADQFVVVQHKNSTIEERKKLRTIETHQMRRLEKNDPQAAIRDFVVGQRIRIQRSHVHLGAGSVEYAQVVDSTPT